MVVPGPPRKPGVGRIVWRRRLIRVLLMLVGITLFVLIAGTVYELTLPSVGDAQSRVSAILTSHNARPGVTPVPGKLGTAVVATEDEHFYSNPMVSVFAGAARAGLATLHTSGDPGGSTISQQLAKRLYVSGSGLGATLKEIGMGVKLSVSYPKAQILEMYLNVDYFGNGYWGYVAASKGYFGISPDKLDWAEASMLAGLLQAPSAYDPFSHLTLAKQRQLQVLSQLVANHDISISQEKSASLETLHFVG